MPTFDAAHFRHVLGHLPTGVVVVAGLDSAGAPTGLAVGSFTSVSLEPPIVSFCVDRASTSWPRIREGGRFCVNVLSHDQADVCENFAQKGGDKFATLRWQASPATHMPQIEGVHAWVDCELAGELEIGDHSVIAARVLALDVARDDAALVFYRGNYNQVVYKPSWTN